MVPLWFVGLVLLAGLLIGMLLSALCIVSGRCEDERRRWDEWDGDCY